MFTCWLVCHTSVRPSLGSNVVLRPSTRSATPHVAICVRQILALSDLHDHGTIQADVRLEQASTRQPGTRARDSEAAAMRAIIQKAFKGVQIRKNRDAFDAKGTLLPSWVQCSHIDYSDSHCLETTGSYVCSTSLPAVQQQLEVLGIRRCFESNSSASLPPR